MQYSALKKTEGHQEAASKMIKKEIYSSNKERLKAGAKDRLYRFIMADGLVRGAVLHATSMINEMRANHDLGILETYILGHAYIAAGLMTMNIQDRDRVALKIECSGPVKGLTVEARAEGEVRGYLWQNPIPVDKPLESFDMSPFFGAGFLSVIKNIEGAKAPFTGQVMIEYGNIAKDLACYFTNSEQIPTAFNLSIRFDHDGNVTGAGGLFLQLMPGADENLALVIETMIDTMPSIGEEFHRGVSPEEIIRNTFDAYSPEILGNHRIEFFCRCTREQMAAYISMLSDDDFNEILENGPFPVEMTCHHCNTIQKFSREDIDEIKRQREKAEPQAK
jgi:molecular chaperone Hsp33